MLVESACEHRRLIGGDAVLSVGEQRNVMIATVFAIYGKLSRIIAHLVVRA